MKRKQIISLLLTLLMLFSSLPIPAYAEWYDEETGNEACSGTVVSASDAIVIPDWDDFSGGDASDSENENAWEEWDEYADFSGEESDETEDSFWYDEEQPEEFETWEEPEDKEPSLDSHVPDSSDQDYAIKQQAIWIYLGQSFPSRDLKAGSRCTLSTDELRAELDSIVASAKSASLDSNYDLWIAYHKENRNYYQDMIFIVYAPTPTATPTPVPTPTPTPVPTATPFVPTPTPEPTLGWIRITKTDSVTGQGMSGIVFAIYQGSTLVGSMTTDENGVAVSEALTKGSYTVKERGVPDGYVADLVSLSCEVKADETTNLTASNTPIRVRIKVIKTDAQTGQPLSGAEFTVKRKDTGAVVATLTTNAQGEAVSDLLPYGEYIVTETKVPSGYIDSGFTATVNGTENGKTYVVKAENQPMQGGIRITKTDKADGNTISGVVFDIYQGTILVSSMITNASGVAVSGDLPVGKYTVKEHALPDGYTGDLFSADCIVVSGEITDLKAENQPIQVKIKIVKTDAQTGQPLSGAEFTVKRKDTGAVVVTLTTNAQGEAVSDLLPYGEYTVTESKVPSGYIDSGFTATVKGTENGKTYVIEAENQPMQGSIRITKTDKADGSPIEGVIFDIYQSSTLVSNMTTNASGVAVSGELPVGKYTVKERALPDGYTGDLFSVDCIVVSGELTELKAENQPIQVKIKVIKTDAQTGQPLSGAEFTVKRKDTSAVVATLTTNAQGEAISDLLPYGEYTVIESKVPNGYIDSGFSTTVKGTEHGKTYVIEAENQPMQGGIRITKTDKADGSPIEGVIFDIYQGTTLIGSMTTNASGVAVSDELPVGKYTVKEHALPDGYTGELFSVDCIVVSGELTDLKAENQPIQVKIKVIKTDAQTSQPLSGAVFTVKRKDTGAVVATLTTNTQGEAVSDLLSFGEYIVIESKVPSGYIDSSFTATVNGTENGKTYVIEAENQPMQGGIRITKTDKTDGSPIEGVIFDIYQGSTLVGSMTTNASGVAVSGELPVGKYTVKEHALPDGYTGELFSVDCIVVSGELTDLKAENQPIQVKIKVIKTDAQTSQPLSGAEFTVKRKDTGAVVATLTTNAQGEAISDLLPYGEYTVTESKVPSGYIDGGFTATVNGTETGKTYVIEVENQPMQGGVRITKTDKSDGSPIEGVVFDIYQGNTLVGSMTTNASGVAVSGDLPTGSYTVKERALPTGYTGELVSLTCSVESNKLTELKAENQPIQVKIKVIKTDAQTGQPLSGAEFTVKRKDTGAVAATLTTNTQGEAVSDLLPYGEYTVTESKVPSGYIDSGFTATVSGTENGKTYVIEAENKPMQGGIRITKTDKANGSPIEGVIFDIYQGTTLMGSMTTNASGVAVSDDLPKGSYTVKERALPDGYTGELFSGECQVTSGKVADLTVENQPIQFTVKIIKTDALTHEPLAGAQFTVTRMDTGVVAATLTTDSKGEATSGLLRYGEYEIKETKVPANYIDSSFSTTINGTEHGKTYVIEAENQPMQGGIRITKTDKLDGSPIAGVVFDIYQDGTKVGSMTTNASGVAVSGELPKGNYTVKEHDLPEGYTGDLVSLDCVVKSNEVTDLKAENLPIQFKVKIVKTDALTKEPLAGAEFSIIRTDNGETVEVLTTNSKGEAVSGLLRYGKYEVRETRIPANYMDNPFSVTVNGTEDGKTYEIQAENQPMAGGIRVIKTDKLDGSPIAGVVFDIYQDGTKVGSMTTNASGVAVSGELPKGNYTVKEHGLPEGYTGELVSLDCVVKSSEITDLTAENQPIQFKVKIVKTDGLTQEPVSGAEFTITKKDTGETVSTLTTDKNGIAISDLLRYGEYTVTETKTPAHYAESTFSTTVNGTENEKVYEIRVENEPTKGQIHLTKTDALDGTPISGVIFDIFDGDKLVGNMKTDENGVAMSDPLPKGNYTVKEHENPEGYVADLVSLDCSVKSDELTELKAENTPIQFRIRILKTDALTKEPLSGAEFTVKRISGLPSHGGTSDGEIVTTLITDEKGEAMTGLLTWGKYEVSETKVPENFIDSHYSETVTGTENEKTYTLTVENEPMKGWLRLTKTDRLDGHPIAGVVFDIIQNGRIVTSMTTDADGVAVSEPIPKGKYTVKEHANPTGYTNDLYCVECEVFSDVTTRMNADNQPIRGRIQITKKDELTKTLLAGAEFTITRVTGLPSHNGKGNGEVVAVLTTDNSGKAVSPLLTWGTYKVEETKVPEHYVDNHFFAMVVIKDNEKTYELTAENEPTKGWIALIKTDALDRTPIAGVQFDIYENDEYGSGLAATMTTDENGVAKTPALRKGKYLVKEHEGLTGYVTDLATVECTVKSDEITHTSATNQPIQGKIRIIKTDELTKEALAGAEFTITRVSGLPSHNGSNDGEVVAVITTDADGIAVTPLLTWGTYKVEETGVPVHYVDNGYSTEVTIQEENLITIDVPVENESTKGWIRLSKTDRKNGNPISGVQFDIFYNDEYGEGLAATMTTGEDGVALSEPLRKGKYIVKEHGQTPGYLFEEITLECTVKSDEITDLSATNQPIMTRLKLYKRDKDEYKKDLNATPGTRGDGVLTGTVYTVRAGEDITDRQGNILYEKGAAVQENLKTSGEEASVLTDALWPGVYEIVEVTPPTGYQLDETPVRVDTTTAAQQSTETVMTYTGVNTNEVLYGRYAFVKFYGDNQVHDDAGLIEKPEADAVFHVYLKSAGSYEAARKFERDTITTDKNGKAQTKLLPYGIYTVEQIKGKKGYAIKAPFDIFIRGTEDPSDPPTMIINNEAIHYRLKFIKVDAETGNTITAAHTSFKLKDGEGNYVTQTVYYPHKEEIDTFTTDETGEVTLPETLIYGLYFAEEFEAPEGYLIATQEIPVFVGDEHFDQPGEAYLLEYKVENEAVKGRILLEKKGLRLTGFEEKTDGFGNTYSHPVYEEKYLPGAVFEIRAAEDILGKDGTLWYHVDELVDTITTTAEGKDASKVLPLGKYYLIEVSAPEGYIFSDERYEANLEYADNHTALVEITVEAHNDYLPVFVSLEKEMEIMEIVQGADNTVRQTVSAAPGEGFVFGLYNDKDIHFESGCRLSRRHENRR